MLGKLLTLLALLVVPAAADIPAVRPPQPLQRIVDLNVKLEQKGKHKGSWYFSVDGHAVYCYGPTMFVQANGGIQKVATFCRGDRVIVPLHE